MGFRAAGPGDGGIATEVLAQVEFTAAQEPDVTPATLNVMVSPVLFAPIEPIKGVVVPVPSRV